MHIDLNHYVYRRCENSRVGESKIFDQEIHTFISSILQSRRKLSWDLIFDQTVRDNLYVL